MYHYTSDVRTVGCADYMGVTLSDCCHAPVVTAHGCDSDIGHNGKSCDCDEGVTMWYECTSCHEVCDINSWKDK